jgi:NAD+ kinase
MSGPGHPFPTIALVGRYGSPGIAEPLSRLAAFLAERGHRVLLDPDTAQYTPLPGYQSAPLAQIGREAKLAIVIGGDGTIQ